MKLVAFLLSAAFLVTFAGGLHPLFDSLSLLRLPLAALLLTILVFRRVRRMRWFLFVASVTLACLAYEAVFWSALKDIHATFTIYQRNLWFGNSELDAIVAEIADYAPDVITFQEVSGRNDALLGMLEQDYPHQHLCTFDNRYNIAVLSRFPPTGSAPVCSNARGLAALEVEAPDGPGWIVSIHLFWPWPIDQRTQLRELSAILTDLPGRKVLAGDFNQVPWSYAVRHLRRVSETNYLGPRRATFRVLGKPLPIDHILAATGSVERLPLLGSDHNGLLARVAFWPS